MNVWTIDTSNVVESHNNYAEKYYADKKIV